MALEGLSRLSVGPGSSAGPDPSASVGAPVSPLPAPKNLDLVVVLKVVDEPPLPPRDTGLDADPDLEGAWGMGLGAREAIGEGGASTVGATGPGSGALEEAFKTSSTAAFTSQVDCLRVGGRPN